MFDSSVQVRPVGRRPLCYPWVYRMLLALCCCAVIGLAAVQSAIAESSAEQYPPEIVDGYRTLDWVELIPEDDLNALLNPPDELLAIDDGSAEDQITSELKSQQGEQQFTSETARRYQQALLSTQVVDDFDGRKVRIPGFVVPLVFGNGAQQVKEFFLVPYFGACIHVPPPPPNQIIYGRYQQSFHLASLSQPYWIYGKVTTTLVENDTATSAYSFVVDKIEPYTDYNG